jgi:2-polyprenyl-3-methyl-5-hydroxy-6-metoxy-1,4-benzoquinol methylase
MFFSPMPSIAQLSTFYSAAYYDFDRSREEGKGLAFARRLRRWKKTGRFLDVGCATGFFINGIRKHSEWEVYGTDFGESAVRFARETLHLNVKQGELSGADFPGAFFDYVHVNNVLEHVLDPVSLLRECRRLIKPDGVFFLSVPNGINDSLDLIDFYYEENKPARSKNGHIFFFPAKTLLRLFDQIGFRVEKKRTYSLKRGLRSAGYLPRKRDWKRDYFPREAPETPVNSAITIAAPRKKHSNFYYRYRFVQGNLQMIPGLHRFGLDFLFILRPAS